MIESWSEIAGYVASALVFVTFSMKTIIPLRVVAILSNIAFVLYGFGAGLVPILILHSALLPLNIFRTYQHVKSFRRIRAAAENAADISALLPFMTRTTLAKGSAIFQMGDPAEEMYFLSKGRVFLPELNKQLGTGEIFGEVGLFSDQQKRTTSAICSEPCELFVIDKAKIVELYHRDSAFGYYLTKLIASRMQENLSRLLPDEMT